jgi:subtilisin family serine protease
MKPGRTLRALALSLALLAPAPALVAQAVPPDAAAVARPPANWWLLDPAADGVVGTSAERAYRELLAGRQPARQVVVAIIDTGVEVDHEDLRDVIWTNPREVAGNGRDDDGNGYVDDVHGWDFIGSRDGRDVTKDTYELTRLYAACRSLAPDASVAAGLERQSCAQVRQRFETNVSEQRQNLQQARQVAQLTATAEMILRQAVGGDSLTLAKVQALKETTPQLAQAKQIYLQLAGMGITAADIAEEAQAMQEGLNQGLNPDFDPRAVVGDNYADATERGYGNAEVEGPFAEHGTHVAGIVAAVRGNGRGIDGVATGARLMVLRVVPDGDERDKDVANAIRYAADNGAHIINMSFGKGASPRKDVVDEAVRYAESKGVLLVHAAGNEAEDIAVTPSFPVRAFAGGGEAKNWIEVGASHWAADSLAASFSNYNAQQVDIFAPGMRIRSTVPGGGYEENQGTSMAAPVVSGVAALLMAYFPSLTAEQVKEILIESATPFRETLVARPGSDERVAFGTLSRAGGVVNAYAAVRLAQQRTGGR